MKIRSILVSVYHKDGLESIAPSLIESEITVYSTGGTQKYLESLGVKVVPVESLTGYPSILDGRVKTLHPAIFGGILAKREDDHLGQLDSHNIPVIDCVVVDLYPFEQTVKDTNDESTIIEKIDIGGISLIRAAAKNYKDVVIIPSADQYSDLNDIMNNNGETDLETRRSLAAQAFNISSHYDTAIFKYLNQSVDISGYKMSVSNTTSLRYGENPHQSANYYGQLDELLGQIQGKPLSYNNLIDIDAAMQIIDDFWDEEITLAILKHTNPCGLATRSTMIDAWTSALSGDPVSSFGGIIITNGIIDGATAKAIDGIFYEVLIAKDFSEEARAILGKKKKRVLLQIKSRLSATKHSRTILNGIIEQDRDTLDHDPKAWTSTNGMTMDAELTSEMVFANRVVKHLKSNAIAITKNKKIIGIGCGQTSRVDALNQAIAKAQHFGFNFEDAILASDAFFPFGDCVELADQVGIKYIVQPGGSIRDQESIDYCLKNDMSMVLTGHRHFKH